jgi:hypothetical protein
VSGYHTHDDGPGGEKVAMVAIVALAVIVFGPAIGAAITGILMALAITLAALTGLTISAITGYLIYRHHHPPQVQPPPWRKAIDSGKTRGGLYTEDEVRLIINKLRGEINR